MKRGGKITRAMKIIRAEQEVLQGYKAEVQAAVQKSEAALAARIISIKVKRNKALERIREGELADAKAESQENQENQTAGSDEASGYPGQRGNEPERSSQSGLEGQGEGQEEETQKMTKRVKIAFTRKK